MSVTAQLEIESKLRRCGGTIWLVCQEQAEVRRGFASRRLKLGPVGVKWGR